MSGPCSKPLCRRYEYVRCRATRDKQRVAVERQDALVSPLSGATNEIWIVSRLR